MIMTYTVKNRLGYYNKVKGEGGVGLTNLARTAQRRQSEKCGYDDVSF